MREYAIILRRFPLNRNTHLALMDGNWITAMRTGAVVAHSVFQFAKGNWNTIGMIGLGNAARATMLVLAAVTPDRMLKIKLLKYKNQAEQFIERLSGFDNLRFEIVDDANTVVKGSDVVISCETYFEADICPDDCFDEGVYLYIREGLPIAIYSLTKCLQIYRSCYIFRSMKSAFTGFEVHHNGISSPSSRKVKST